MISLSNYYLSYSDLVGTYASLSTEYDSSTDSSITLILPSEPKTYFGFLTVLTLWTFAWGMV